MTFGECSFGLQRIFEPSDTHNRKVDGFSNGGGDEHRVTRRHVHAGLDHEKARRGNPDRGVDVVDMTGRFDIAGDLDRVVDGRATLDQLIAQMRTPRARPLPIAVGRTTRCQ